MFGEPVRQSPHGFANIQNITTGAYDDVYEVGGGAGKLAGNVELSCGTLNMRLRVISNIWTCVTSDTLATECSDDGTVL